MSEQKTTDRELEDFLSPSEGTIDPAHEAWLKKEIADTLEEAKSGKLSYRSLDEMRAKYGFDAR